MASFSPDQPYVFSKEHMEYFAAWATTQHRSTHHFYADILPYEFHLKLAASVAQNYFQHLQRIVSLEYRKIVLQPDCPAYIPKNMTQESMLFSIFAAIWGHDLLEDTRVSYNDIVKAANDNTYVAELIFALTNPLGRNRNERNSSEYYKGILSVPGASFCKLCDRIANLRYAKLYGNIPSDSMYRKEHTRFSNFLFNPTLAEMFYEIDRMFT